MQFTILAVLASATAILAAPPPPSHGPPPANSPHGMITSVSGTDCIGHTHNDFHATASLSTDICTAFIPDTDNVSLDKLFGAKDYSFVLYTDTDCKNVAKAGTQDLTIDRHSGSGFKYGCIHPSAFGGEVWKAVKLVEK